MNLKSRSKVDPTFNMSSMTDLVFLLLIFFMILSTQVKPTHVMGVSLPSASSQEKSTAKARVSIDKDLNYYVDKDPVSVDAIGAVLRQKLGSDPDAKVEIAVDESVPHRFFVQVADIVSVQNKYKMVLVTKPVSQ